MRRFLDHLYEIGFSNVPNTKFLNQYGARIDVDDRVYGILITDVGEIDDKYDVMVSVEGPMKEDVDRIMEGFKNYEHELRAQFRSAATPFN